MILSVVVIGLVALIAYWNFVQGFFGATISAICAILAAAIAFSYHEVVITKLAGGKITDQGNAIALVVLFASVFMILRVMFDSFVPGNLRFPPTLDKVGGAVMGAVAGIFGIGTLIIAMQTMPFGPEIAGYSRYQLAGAIELTVGGAAQASDLVIKDSLKSPRDLNDPDGFVEADRGSLWLPVDDIVVGTVKTLSKGSLAGTQPLDAIHPDYLDEMFGDRLGIQLGAQHVALNLPGRESVKVDGAFILPPAPAAEFELEDITKKISRPKIPDTITPKPTESLLVIRTVFTPNATDTDRNARFSPGSVRLVAAGKNYAPIGHFDAQGVLRVTMPDDFMFVPAEGAADLVFLVQNEDVFSGAATAPKGDKADKAAAVGKAFKPDVFLSVKRLANISLGDKVAEANFVPSEIVKVLKKDRLPAPKSPVTAMAAPSKKDAAPGAASSQAMPVTLVTADISEKFPNPINTAAHGPDGDVTFAAGTMTLKANGAAQIQITSPVSIASVSAGDFLVESFNQPAGFKVVQLQVQPEATRGADPWRFADELGSIELGDSKGKRYKPVGVWVKLKQNEEDKLIVSYDASGPLASLAHTDGRPTDMWLLYLIPEGTELSEIAYKGKRVKPIASTV